MNKTYVDANEKKATYEEKWEAIYADREFDKQYLQDIKNELIKDGYKVVHVVTGEQEETAAPKRKRRRSRGR